MQPYPGPLPSQTISRRVRRQSFPGSQRTLTHHSRFDAANQLGTEQYRRDTTTYTYDANGNTQVINAGGSLTTNTWDIENRITKAELPGAVVNTITYDGDGKRRRLEDSAGLRNYLWDGENIARQTDVNNATNRRYTLDPQVYGELISQDGPAFHHGVYPERSRGDALGSTRNLATEQRRTR